MADRRLVGLARDLIVAARRRQRGPRRGLGRLGLRHVGLRHLADLETVARSFQVFTIDMHRVLVDRDLLGGAFDTGIGADRAQQYALLDRAQRLARCQNGFLLHVDGQPGAAEIIKRHLRDKRGIGGEPVVALALCPIGGDRRVGRRIAVIGGPLQHRAQRRHRLRHVLVGGTQRGAVLFEQVRGAIGRDQRIGERLGRDGKRRRHQPEPRHGGEKKRFQDLARHAWVLIWGVPVASFGAPGSGPQHGQDIPIRLYEP